MAGSPLEPNMSFEHAWAKVLWAQEHIKNLNTLNNRIVEEHPRTTSIRVEDDTHWVIHVEPTEPIPANIPLQFGDAMHNLRAALDYCWMGLLRATSDSPGKKTLPRGSSRDEVEGTLRKAAVEQRIQGVDKFILDTLQPYESGNQVLWLIGQIDNWNKHNLLVATLGATNIRRAKVSSVSGAISNSDFSGCRVISGVPETHYTFTIPTGDELKFDEEPDIAVEIFIGFGESENKGSLMPFAGAALQETAKAVKLFAAAFGKPAAN